MSSSAIEPGKDYASIGPTLPAEAQKPPYGPKVAGRMAFFFGPVAGALISIVNLRRMGFPLRSKRILGWTVAATTLLATVIILLPDAFGRIVGLGAEISFYVIYPRLQEAEFAQWQSTHPDVQTSNGWGAIGWAILGLLGFLLIAVMVGMVLGLFFPNLA